MKIRIIHTVSSDGSLGKEEVTFTDDFNGNSGDYYTKDMEVVSDKVYTIALPDSFPINSTFTKIY